MNLFEICFYLVSVAVAVIAAVPNVVKLSALFLPRSPKNRSGERMVVTDLIFVSIHMAVYDEPPELVIRSLEALQLLDYPVNDFEVIVFDNNTTDEKVWRPVQDWCEKTGGPFRFFHEMNVRGAKAGALNLAMELCDPRTKYVAVVDADYEVNSYFLKRAVCLLENEELSHVQFPQAYRDVSRSVKALEDELSSYFGSYATAAGRADAMLLTGTLSVIRKGAIIEAGGWPVETITEDAHLGALMLRNQGEGKFVDEEMGKGLLPGCLDSLSKQRFRWAAGNGQTLLILLKNRARGLNLAVVGQLCAWLNGAALLLPCWIVASYMPRMKILELSLGGLFFLLVALELVLVFLSAGGQNFPKVGGSNHSGKFSETLARRWHAMLVRFALLPEAGRGLIAALLGQKLKFIRTPKALSVRETVGGVTYFYMGVFLLGTTFLSGQFGLVIPPLIVMMLGGARLWLDRALRSGSSQLGAYEDDEKVEALNL